MATYARVAVARSGSGFTVTSTAATLTAAADFPEVATGSGTITHFGVGRASSGAGELLFKGTINPTIAIAAGVIPRLKTGTTITQAASDGMPNTTANNLLLLLLNNTTWANIGDPTGIVGSTSAGSLYLSLHTADPGDSGNQTTSEVSYT